MSAWKVTCRFCGKTYPDGFLHADDTCEWVGSVEPFPGRSTTDSEGVADGLPRVPTSARFLNRIGYQPGDAGASLRQIAEPMKRVGRAMKVPGEPASHGGTCNHTGHRDQSASESRRSRTSVAVSLGRSTRNGSPSPTSMSSIPYVSSPPDREVGQP